MSDHEDEGWSVEMVLLVLYGMVVLGAPLWGGFLVLWLIETVR